jgi:hypothetical protein
MSGFSNSWVSRQLASDFIEYFEGAIKPMPQTDPAPQEIGSETSQDSLFR